MKTLIAMPVYDGIKAETFHGIIGNIQKDISISIEPRSLVMDARNNLAVRALEGGYDNILWIDADMDFGPGAVAQIIEDIEGRDYVTGLCFKRSFPVMPVILKELYWDKSASGIISHGSKIYTDYPKDDIFEIAGSGMAFCIMKTKLLQDIVKQFNESPFNQLPQMGEDYSFCWRLQQLGVKMYCDSRLKIGHVGTYVYREEDWLRQEGLTEKSDDYQIGYEAGLKAGRIEAIERLGEWIEQKNS